MKPDVLLYTTSCYPLCRRAKTLQWNEFDIEADQVHRQAMTEASGRNAVPQILINGTHVGGSDELCSSMPKANSTNFSRASRLRTERLRPGRMARAPRAGR